MLAVNSEVICLYWRIGKLIDERSEWGKRFIDSLPGDIRLAYPGIRGFSVRNLKFMLRLASESTSNLCSRWLHKFAERPLRSTSAPIGVSEYRTADELPEEMRGILPTPEDIASRI